LLSGALREAVLEQTREAIVCLPETGVSMLGMSHRSDWFRSILNEAEQNAVCEDSMPVPLIADMSSHFLSKPFRPDLFSMMMPTNRRTLVLQG
jgi:phosphoserine aminotransferase